MLDNFLLQQRSRTPERKNLKRQLDFVCTRRDLCDSRLDITFLFIRIYYNRCTCTRLTQCNNVPQHENHK